MRIKLVLIRLRQDWIYLKRVYLINTIKQLQEVSIYWQELKFIKPVAKLNNTQKKVSLHATEYQV